MANKTKLQTYNFLIENKSIEDIKKQKHTTFKEKRRHGGLTIKFFNKTNKEPSWIIVVNDNQSITEEIIHFYQDNNEIEVMKQLKQYENINKYKDDLSLIEPNSNHEKTIKFLAPICTFVILATATVLLLETKISFVNS